MFSFNVITLLYIIHPALLMYTLLVMVNGVNFRTADMCCGPVIVCAMS